MNSLASTSVGWLAVAIGVVQLVGLLFLIAAATLLTAAARSAAPDPAASWPAVPTSAPWPMFHRDERRTGVTTDTAGNFLPSGRLGRWTYRVYTPTD